MLENYTEGFYSLFCSATYTLQVPNVTKSKLTFQVSRVEGVHLICRITACVETRGVLQDRVLN